MALHAASIHGPPATLCIKLAPLARDLALSAIVVEQDLDAAPRRAGASADQRLGNSSFHGTRTLCRKTKPPMRD
jgi:hypothetical protein